MLTQLSLRASLTGNSF